MNVTMSSQIFVTLIDLTFESFTNPLLLNDALGSIIHRNRLQRLVFPIELSFRISCGMNGYEFFTLFVQISYVYFFCSNHLLNVTDFLLLLLFQCSLLNWRPAQILQ